MPVLCKLPARSFNLVFDGNLRADLADLLSIKPILANGIKVHRNTFWFPAVDFR